MAAGRLQSYLFFISLRFFQNRPLLEARPESTSAEAGRVSFTPRPPPLFDGRAEPFPG